MSEDLGRTGRYAPCGIPLRRVRCAGCGRIYETASWPNQIARLSACWGCRVGRPRQTPEMVVADPTKPLRPIRGETTETKGKP